GVLTVTALCMDFIPCEPCPPILQPIVEGPSAPLYQAGMNSMARGIPMGSGHSASVPCSGMYDVLINGFLDLTTVLDQVNLLLDPITVEFIIPDQEEFEESIFCHCVESYLANVELVLLQIIAAE